MNSRTPRSGVTLIELLVTLTILGLLAGVAGLALHAAPAMPPFDPASARVTAARDSALRTGHPVTAMLLVNGDIRYVTAIPDGRVLADGGLAIDPLAGNLTHAATP